MGTALPAESGGSRAVTVLTHALPWVLGVAIPLRVAAWFGLLTWLDLAAATVLLVCMVATLRHQRAAQLCLRCMEEVHVDAPVRAERRRALLWFTHFMASGVGIAAYLATFGVAAVGTAFGVPLAKVPLDLMMFATLYSTWVHHRLRPWCPYCRNWDEDGEPEPAPDPSEFGTRTGH